MAWTKTTKAGGLLVAEETNTLPASATIGYSSEIDFAHPNPNLASRKITVTLNASAVAGTNLDIALYGAASTGGTKFLLLDAVVADITATGTVAATIDLNSYPAPYYYISWTADADNSANTIAVKVIVPRANG
jgi:hypothetical protein